MGESRREQDCEACTYFQCACRRCQGFGAIDMDETVDCRGCRICSYDPNTQCEWLKRHPQYNKQQGDTSPCSTIF